MKNGSLQTVRFARNAEGDAYHCDKPDDMTGAYYDAAAVDAFLEDVFHAMDGLVLALRRRRSNESPVPGVAPTACRVEGGKA